MQKLLLMLFVAALSCNGQAEERKYRYFEKSDTEFIHNFFSSRNEIVKGQYETTVAFEKRKRLADGKFYERMSNTVYIFQEDAGSVRYDADRQRLSVGTPLFQRAFRKSHELFYLNTFDALYYRKAKNKLNIHVASLPASMKRGKFKSDINVGLPTLQAKKYDGQYKWVIGVLFDDLDSYAVQYSYSKYSGSLSWTDHNLTGKLAFAALVPRYPETRKDTDKEPVFGYFTKRNSKEAVELFLR